MVVVVEEVEREGVKIFFDVSSPSFRSSSLPVSIRDSKFLPLALTHLVQNCLHLVVREAHARVHLFDKRRELVLEVRIGERKGTGVRQ